MFALPLKLDGGHILDANGVVVAITYSDKHGAEIIAAVNSHAKLIAAAKGIIAAYGTGNAFHALDELQAAIAAAEEAAS